MIAFQEIDPGLLENHHLVIKLERDMKHLINLESALITGPFVKMMLVSNP